jgi:Ca-activated chloride channel family protein
MPAPRLLFLGSLLLTLSVVVPTFAQDDDDVVTVDSSIVVLNATVTDPDGRHVPGLKKAQFKILENGIEQEVSMFAAEDTPFAAVVLLDTSGSMEQRISLARSAAIRFLDGLRESDSAKIYRFDSKTSLVQKFSNSRDVTDKIFDIRADGYTALYDAIYQASADLSKREESRRAIIILSDGADNRSGKSADAALKAALAVNASIYTVDMSAIDTGGKERMQNPGALRNFAEKTGGMFIATPGGSALRIAFEQIVAELGSQYTIAYQPKTSAKDGKWRTLELRVTRPNLTIRTRKGYHSAKR